MILVVQMGSGDIIERMWRLMVAARRNADIPEIWRLTEEILQTVRDFYRLSDAHVQPVVAESEVPRFLDIPVDPTTTQPHLLCRPDVVYHL